MRFISTLILLLVVATGGIAQTTTPIYGTYAYPGIQDGNYRGNEKVTVVTVTNNLNPAAGVWYTQNNSDPSLPAPTRKWKASGDTITLNLWDTIPKLGEPHPSSVITLWTDGDIPRRYAYWYMPLLQDSAYTSVKPTVAAFPGDTLSGYSFYGSQLILLKALRVTNPEYSLDGGNTWTTYKDRDTIRITSSCTLSLKADKFLPVNYPYTLLSGTPGPAGMNAALNTPDSIQLTKGTNLLALTAYPNSYNMYAYYNMPTTFWFTLYTQWHPDGYSLTMSAYLVDPSGNDNILVSNVSPVSLGMDNMGTGNAYYQYTMPSILRYLGLSDSATTYDYLSNYKLRIELQGYIPSWSPDYTPGTNYSQTMVYPLQYLSPISTVNAINLDIYQNEKIGINLEEMLRTMGYLGGPADSARYNAKTDSVYWWYMADPYSPPGTVYTQNRFEIKTLLEGGGSTSTKLTPWINSSEQGTFTYYARTGNGDIPVYVKVNPPFSIDTTSYSLLRTETFGTGDSNNGPQIPTRTNYKPASNTFPGDGYYAIMKKLISTGNTFPPDWKVGMTDHTQPGTGYMYVVNADTTKAGMFYTDTIDACANKNLRFSAYYSNLCNGTFNSGDYAGYRIHPNVLVRLIAPATASQPKDIILKETYTGDIPTYGFQNLWKKYNLNVNLLDGGKIIVQLLNVNLGGLGNDFAIDDISIERAVSKLKITTSLPQCDLSNNLPEFILGIDPASVVANFTDMNLTDKKLYYKWVKNDTTLLKMDSILYTSFVSTTFNDTLKNAQLNGDIYTFSIASSIASDSAALDDACVSSVSYQMIKPNISLNANVADGSLVCPCTPVILSASVDGDDSGSGSLIWYKESLTEENEIGTGSSITVTPEETTKYYVAGLCVKDSITIQIGSSPSLNFGTLASRDYYYRDQEIYAMRVSIADSGIVKLPVNFVRGAGLVGYTILDSIKGDTIAQGGPLTAALDSLASQYLPIQMTNAVKPTRSDFRQGENIVRLLVTLRDQGTNICPDTIPLRLHIISDSSVWVPKDNSTTNWNDDANWEITDYQGNRYAEGGVPMANTDTWIPGDAATYPILKSRAAYQNNEIPTDDGFDAYPKAHTIHFQMGGEVAQLQYLQYLKAFVDMNLGTYDNSKKFTNTANAMNTDAGSNYYPYYLARDRYYSMSAPLKNMYAGDYAFGGKPNAYMKYADPIPINEVRGDSEAELIQKWTNSINTYKVPFTAGFGFGYQVYSGDLKTPWPAEEYKYNQENLNAVKGLVQWPYFTDSVYLKKINPFHTFDGDSTGKGNSTFTYYAEGRPDSTLSKTDEAARQSTKINNIITQTVYNQAMTIPLGNRFIVENDKDTIPYSNYPVADIGNVNQGEVLIGNPFMSHLDFKQFYLKNINTIGNYYRIWQSASSQYFSIQVDETTGDYVASTNSALAQDAAGADADTLIAPMQSFFVPVNPGSTGSTVTFSIDSMSTIYPGKLVALRSSNPNSGKEILKITAANSRYSATAVIINKPGEKGLGEGVPKLFASSPNVPEIYLIQDYKKEIIEIDGTDQAIPLEIKTQVTGGNLKLTFTGLENFSSKVALKDTKTGEKKKLSASDNVYSFLNSEGDQKNRFFLLIGDYSGINTPSPSLISVYANRNHVNVHASSLDPIQSVRIYNAVGQAVESVDGLSVTSYESRFIGEKGVYIVDVRTGNKARVTKKVIIY